MTSPGITICMIQSVGGDAGRDAVCDDAGGLRTWAKCRVQLALRSYRLTWNLLDISHNGWQCPVHQHPGSPALGRQGGSDDKACARVGDRPHDGPGLRPEFRHGTAGKLPATLCWRNTAHPSEAATRPRDYCPRRIVQHSPIMPVVATTGAICLRAVIWRRRMLSIS